MIACGTIAGSVLSALDGLDVAVWAVTELFSGRFNMPDEIVFRLGQGAAVVVVEEHRARGGLGSILAREILLAGLRPVAFRHLFALGYPSGRYGSQQFHRRESGLDANGIRASVTELLKHV